MKLPWQTSAPVGARSIGEILAATPAASTLLFELGYDPAQRQRAEAILQEMKSLVRTEITDFAVFRQMLQAAAGRPGGKEVSQDGGRPAVCALEVRNRELLDAVLAAGDDEQAALRVLNVNPVYEQIPFLEQVPVARGGETIWVAPIEHTHIQKRASDPVRFQKLIEEMQTLYGAAHPARRDLPRVALLEALQRLERESKRERSYLPAALQLLESRVAIADAESINPQAKEAAETLCNLLVSCEELETKCQAMSYRRENAAGLRKEGARIAATYLAVPRLHQPWLTSQVIVTLMAPALFDVVRWPGMGLPKAVALIRNELRAESYDAAEMATRVRHLESKGLYVISLVFPLLTLHLKVTSVAGRAAQPGR